MTLVSTNNPPVEADYTPLSQHQEQTPGSFFAGKPVLHYRISNSVLQVNKQDFVAQEVLREMVREPERLEADEEGFFQVNAVDVWVGSRDLRLWSPNTTKGVQILYPAITVHAQLGSAILLELNLSDSNITPDEDIEHLQLRIVPSTSPGTADGSSSNGTSDRTSALYKAIGDCQELNPDPADRDSEDEEQGGFDETVPGITGWITSENMGDFVDAEGNLKMPEGVTLIDGEDEAQEDGEALGQGAGRVRRAEEIDGDEEGDGKWQRTG